MSTALTVRLHLRKAWDEHFLPGTTTLDKSVKRLRMACSRAGLVVLAEYRENYPAPGLSGVLFTRLPRGMSVAPGRGLRNNATAGL